MMYVKPCITVYDEDAMKAIVAMAGSGNCKCGNGSSQNGSKRARA